MNTRWLSATLMLWAWAPMAHAASPAFYQTWSDGKGEINVYRLVEERYHEPRQGHAVLVYVSEELNSDTYIKVESDRTPPEKRMFVLKLNSTRKFPTGVYDYSTMTSVFSVPESHLGFPPFSPARITHSTQEWCGQVYERMELRRDGWHRNLYSYFEAEGERSETLPSAGIELEDNLWIKIRELDQPWLQPGETAQVMLLESAWERRKTHQPPTPRSVSIQKRDAEPISTGIGRLEAFVWHWTAGEREVTVLVEKGGQHRILGWTDSHGGKAEIVSSERMAYWQLNDDHQVDVRQRLKLPDQKLLP